MNILFLTSTVPVSTAGGIEAVTLQLCQIFRQAGHKVFVLSKFPALDIQNSPENFYVLPNREQNAVSPDNLSFAGKLCADKKIDIVINNGIHHDLVHLGHELKSSHIIVISCWHSDPYTQIKAVGDRLAGVWFSNAGIKRWSETLKVLCKMPVNYASSLTWLQKKYREMYDFSDACVLLSSNHIKAFSRIAKLKDIQRIYTIPNPAKLPSSPEMEQKKRKIVLWLGRMDFISKRPDRMLLVWQKVQPENPDWDLWMCGEGPARCPIENYCRQNNIRNVKFYGRVDSSKIYSQSSIFCLTSSCEGFGLVVTEAISHKIPVIAFSYPALYDIAVEGENSIFVPPFSIKKYADALNDLMQNNEKRIAMANCDRSYLQRFSGECIGKQWEDLFRKLKRTEQIQ